MNATQHAEALRQARESARRHNIPPALAERIMNTVLAARGHLSPSDDPFNALLFPQGNPFFDDPSLDPGWDDGGNPLGASDFPLGAPGVTRATTVTAVLVDSDTGEFKIVKLGHKLVEEDLSRLGHPELVKAIIDFHATSRLLDAAKEERTRLESRIRELRQLVSYEPELIQHAIRLQFSEGTAGQDVEITANVEVGGFNLAIGGKVTSVNVPEDFGKRMWTRQEDLDDTKECIVKNVSRQHELGLQVADLGRVLPVLQAKVHHLFGQLNLAALTASLDGEFIGLDFDEQGQIVALVRREVNETLTELPEASKRALIAQILSGRKMPEAVQKSLGIYNAIRAVTSCLNPPAPEPEIAAPEAKATAKPKGKAKRRAS